LVAGGAVAGGAVGGGAAAAAVVVVLVASPSWANSSSSENTGPLDLSTGVPVVLVVAGCGTAVEVVVDVGFVGRAGASTVVLVGEVEAGAATAAEAGEGSLLMNPPTTPAVPRALIAPTIRRARLAGWRRAEKGFICSCIGSSVGVT